ARNRPIGVQHEAPVSQLVGKGRLRVRQQQRVGGADHERTPPGPAERSLPAHAASLARTSRWARNIMSRSARASGVLGWRTLPMPCRYLMPAAFVALLASPFAAQFEPPFGHVKA